MILYLEAEGEALSKHTINWQGTVHLIHFEFAHGHGYIRVRFIRVRFFIVQFKSQLL